MVKTKEFNIYKRAFEKALRLRGCEFYRREDWSVIALYYSDKKLVRIEMRLSKQVVDGQGHVSRIWAYYDMWQKGKPEDFTSYFPQHAWAANRSDSWTGMKKLMNQMLRWLDGDFELKNKPTIRDIIKARKCPVCEDPIFGDPEGCPHCGHHLG